MRKLRSAEEKFLKNFPKDMMSNINPSEILFDGQILPYGYPKGTNCRTVESLFELKLIETARTRLVHYPISLTNKGRYLRKKLNEED